MATDIYRRSWKGFIEIIKDTTGHNPAAISLSKSLTYSRN